MDLNVFKNPKENLIPKILDISVKNSWNFENSEKKRVKNSENSAIPSNHDAPEILKNPDASEILENVEKHSGNANNCDDPLHNGVFSLFLSN